MKLTIGSKIVVERFTQVLFDAVEFAAAEARVDLGATFQDVGVPSDQGRIRLSSFHGTDVGAAIEK